MHIEPDLPLGGAYSVASIDGIPLVSLGAQSNGALVLAFARATTSEPADEGDWLLHIVEPEEEIVGFPMLMDMGGAPAVAYRTLANPRELRLARAASATPSGPGDWAQHSIDSVGQQPGMGPSLTLISGLPVVVYGNAVGAGGLSLALAGTADPQNGEDWTVSSLYQVRAESIGLLDVGGNPVVILAVSATAGLYYAYPDF
ncbi:hypothetical protein IIA79_03325, partial [bacterium]|nr:hypothetical protein [bacterium]